VTNYAELSCDEPKDGLFMPGSEGLERWNEVDIPDDMPVSRILRDYVGQVCGVYGFRAAGPMGDPCDVIGLLWGAVFGLEERLADVQRRVDALKG
jgi:hypothetical protein